jgi:hypothetical protein
MNQPADATGRIEVNGNCAYYRPAGKVTLEEAVDLLDQAIAWTRDQRIPRLFINAKALVGFPSPSLPARYFFCRRWAETGQNRVQLALVIRAEMMDPEKFGVVVARNVGMNVDAFTEENEALDWLSAAADE